MSQLLMYASLIPMWFAAGNHTPPGTIHLGQNLFMDQTEVANIHWFEYIYWLKQEHGEDAAEVKQALPDSATWQQLYGEQFSASTFNHAYADYPIVGISYEQALQYCTWRTKVVNQILPDLNLVAYRLPSESELTAALPSEQLNITKYNDAKLNLYRTPDKVRGQHILFLSNNVSEMTAEQGTAFGGSYADSSNGMKVYTKPEEWLGFRCVAVVE